MDTGKVIRQVVIAGAAFGAMAAGAHPNHADPGTTTTLLHLLTQPDHVLMILGTIGVVVTGLARVRRDDREQSARRRKQ